MAAGELAGERSLGGASGGLRHAAAVAVLLTSTLLPGVFVCVCVGGGAFYCPTALGALAGGGGVGEGGGGREWSGVLVC